jgi:hypothetical protein
VPAAIKRQIAPAQPVLAARAVAQDGLVLGPTAKNVYPDAVLRDGIIAGDRLPACSSQQLHILGSREPILVDMALALGVISLVLRIDLRVVAPRARARTS